MAWERNCFLPEQNRTKIDREPASQTCKFLLFWKNNFAAVSLPQHDSWVAWLIVLRRHWWGSFAWLFRSAKVGQNHFLSKVVLDAPVLGQFCPGKKQCLSHYPRENFDQTTPLKGFVIRRFFGARRELFLCDFFVKNEKITWELKNWK